MKKELLLCAFLLVLVQWSNAQTVKVFSKTGLLKGTYTTIAAAFKAGVEGDSFLLSPHTFKEHDLVAYYSLTDNTILQGTISGKDTSTIDAQSLGSGINTFYGTIRDVVITGGHPYGSSYGGGVYRFRGHLTGYTTIRNNVGVGSCIQIIRGVIDENVKIVDNIVSSSTDKYTAALVCSSLSGWTTEIKDNVIISGNKGGGGGGIYTYGLGRGDTTSIKTNGFLNISGNVRIENNEGLYAGGIFSQNIGRYINISGASIINNYVINSGWGAAISVDSGGGVISGTPYDSIGVPLIRLYNVRIYNPLPSGARQTEILMHNHVYTLTSSHPAYFYSDACWWGNSDTTGLFQLDTGTYFSMPTWAVTQWSATPFGTALSNVRSQMKLNTGAALPSNSLSGLQANFWATAGTFSAPTATINASNYLASDYYFPTSGSYKVYAAIDADTFKPSTKALGIPYLLPTTKISIYPNPILDYLHLESINPIGAIRIIDSKGQTVLEANIPTNKHSLEVSSLAKGMYWIIITGTNGVAGKAQLLKQ
jgi:hypothetical protein